MALYFYRALSKAGKKIHGYLDASSEAHVRADLASKSLYPILIQPQTEATTKISFFSSLFEKSVSQKDIIFFTKQLAVLLKSGIPLVQALELLSDQFSGKLQSIIITLKDSIKDGLSLADSLAKYPKTFSNIYIQLVKAGEATGKLEVILERLTEYLEQADETQKRISKALSYPLFQLAIISLVVVGIITQVIPTVQTMLTSFNKELPWATEFLINLSYALTHYYLAIIITLIIIAALFQYWLSTSSGKQTVDQLKLKLPLIKYFARTNAVVQFCRTLGMLLESGVNLSQALDIVCNIIDNSILVKTLEEAKDKIIKQGKITPFLKETNLFPPMAIYLINTGEQSGNLDLMLLTVAKNYETDLVELTDSLTSKIDPIMILVMGAIVGFIMWAVMGPIFSLYDFAGM